MSIFTNEYNCRYTLVLGGTSDKNTYCDLLNATIIIVVVDYLPTNTLTIISVIVDFFTDK